MAKLVFDTEQMLKCSCGTEFPVRWVNEGKAGLKRIDQEGNKSIKKYCVHCANDEEYATLENEFVQFMKVKE